MLMSQLAHATTVVIAVHVVNAKHAAGQSHGCFIAFLPYPRMLGGAFVDIFSLGRTSLLLQEDYTLAGVKSLTFSV